LSIVTAAGVVVGLTVPTVVTVVDSRDATSSAGAVAGIPQSATMRVDAMRTAGTCPDELIDLLHRSWSVTLRHFLYTAGGSEVPTFSQFKVARRFA
jgi:hypothetical protein